MSLEIASREGRAAKVAFSHKQRVSKKEKVASLCKNVTFPPGGLRVGEEVAPLTPHRSGRAQLRHPVPQRADSLTVWRSDGQSEAAVTEIG
jgi:hypothetical protein